MAVAHALDQVREGADAAGGDHRHRDGIGDRARQGNVEALLGAVAVHGGQQDLARAELGHALCPVDRADPRRAPATVGKNLPAAGRRLLGVDRHHHALAAEFLGGLAHEVRPRHRRRVDRGLVGARQQQATDVFDLAHLGCDFVS